MLLPIMMHSQVLSSLGVAKEITKGTLPNGVEYYLVQNTSDKGFADYALVRTASLSIEDERKSLCGLPHFTDRKPWQFFSEHGVGYSSYGYYTEEGPAGVFRFSNVPVYNQSVADSTMLMLVDMTALSRSPQAVVVSGDINPSKLKERLNLLSMTVPQLDCPSGESSYKWVQKDIKRSILINNPSSDVAAISAIISSARTSRELMDSPQPIVTSMYAELVGKVISDRVRRDFRSRGIPLADVEFSYAGSDAGPSDERYGFTLYTSAKCANVATDCFARILSDLDRNGALMDEFVDAKAQLSGDVRSGRLAGKLDNAAYVDKCVSAFLYGSNLASNEVIAGLMTAKNIAPEKELPLFNSFISALLDGEKNLTLRFNVPDCGLDAESLGITFSEAWKEGSDRDYSYKKTFSDTLSLYAPKSKVKLRSEIKEPISGGSLWTFSNGIRVLYKKTAARGEFHYSLMLRGGVASVPDIHNGESAFVGDMLSLDSIAGLNPYDFKAMLSSNGITMKGSAGISDMRISGIAPKSKFRLLLRCLLSVSESRVPDRDAFNYYKQCEALRIDMESLSARDVNSLMDSIMRPEYFFTERKYIERLGDDLPERCEQYFDAQFAKVNDGLLVLMGDLDEEHLKKELCRALGSFHVMKKFAQRPAVNSRLASGAVSYTVESGPGLVGGSEIGVNVAMAAPVPYNMENQVAFRIATSCIRKELVKALSDKGAFFELTEKLEVFPDERMSVFVNCHPCIESGLPADVSAATPLDMLDAVRKVMGNIATMPLSKEDFNAFKEELQNDFQESLQDTEHVIDAVLIRYAEGKDFVTGFKEALKSVTPEKVRSLLGTLASGASVEYIII